MKDPNLNLIQEAYRRGDLRGVERMCQNQLKTFPDHPGLHNLFAIAAARNLQLDVAERHARRALALDPHEPGFALNLAMILEQLGNIDEAVALNEKLLISSPGHADAHFNLGNLKRLGHHFASAERHYQAATRAAPGRADIVANLGGLLGQRGHHEEAIAMTRKALALAPADPQILNQLGSLQLSAGSVDDAGKSFSEAVRIDGSYVDALCNLAIAQLLSAGADAALRTVKRIAIIEPANRTAVAVRCVCAARTGDDETLRRLLDYDRLVHQAHADVPKEFATLADFNNALREHVLAHPSLEYEPQTKTTRRGSQTANLLQGNSGPVASLVEIIKRTLGAYLRDPRRQTLPGVSDLGDWELNVWATVLDEGGHQLPHIHPAGLLSGVYYVDVPGKEGAIEFGALPHKYGPFVSQHLRSIQPRSGDLIVFPSYVYHRTLDFVADRQRISIAFDLIPRHRDPNTAPEQSAVILAQASDLRKKSRFDQARSLIKELLTGNRGYAEGWFALGQLEAQTGNNRAANDALEKAASLAPHEVRYPTALAVIYQRLGDYDQARQALDACLKIDPDNMDTLMSLASVHTDLGQTEQAVQIYERIITAHRHAGRAYYGIALLKKFKRGDPLINAMEACIQRAEQNPRDASGIHFALGRAYEDVGEYDRSFDHYNLGNQIKRIAQPFDAATEISNARRIRESFDRELFQRFAGSGDPSSIAVLIVGMPRSGTTLVEQIIASHPQTHGAGEINELWKTLSRIGRFMPAGSRLPEAVKDVVPTGWATLGGHYVTALTRIADHHTAARITDKLPFNYTLLGMARLMLPNIYIIDCVRNPLDTCISCYATSFGGDRGYTNDLRDLGLTYRSYRDLMRHWEKVLPGAIHTVRYEDLIADTEVHARRLIAYLDLPWSERCLEFHRHDRAITTASHAQVRKPIYTTSIDRWRRFDAHLGPLRDALAEPSSQAGRRD